MIISIENSIIAKLYYITYTHAPHTPTHMFSKFQKIYLHRINLISSTFFNGILTNTHYSPYQINIFSGKEFFCSIRGSNFEHHFGSENLIDNLKKKILIFHHAGLKCVLFSKNNWNKKQLTNIRPISENISAVKKYHKHIICIQLKHIYSDSKNII